MSSINTGARLGTALLAYMMSVTLIVTLLPFQFRMPEHWRVMMNGTVKDVFANILLFVPLGFLYRLARPRARRHRALSVLLIGAAVSSCIETAQLFLSVRNASP